MKIIPILAIISCMPITLQADTTYIFNNTQDLSCSPSCDEAANKPYCQALNNSINFSGTKIIYDGKKTISISADYGALFTISLDQDNNFTKEFTDENKKFKFKLMSHVEFTDNTLSIENNISLEDPNNGLSCKNIAIFSKDQN